MQTPVPHLWGHSQHSRRSGLKVEALVVLGLLGPILAGPRGKALMEVKHGEEAGLWRRQGWGARIRALAQGPGLSLMEEVPVCYSRTLSQATLTSRHHCLAVLNLQRALIAIILLNLQESPVEQ